MTTWFVIYLNENGFRKWKPVKAKHTMDAKDKFAQQYDYTVVDVVHSTEYKLSEEDIERFKRNVAGLL